MVLTSNKVLLARFEVTAEYPNRLVLKAMLCHILKALHVWRFKYCEMIHVHW